MIYRESETVELKQAYSDSIRKEIIALANSMGGTIYVGVADDGGIVGISDCDTLIQRISNGVRDAVKPDVTMFLHYETTEEEGKQIVMIQVQCGTARPYYLAAKGLCSEGVFVRQGTSSVPASDAMIRKMIKETDGDNYEDMRSLNQDLTFHAAAAEFSMRNLPFDAPQMKTLGIIGIDGIYTNLGLLMSDQCPHIIKGATFGGTDQEDFQDRKEFSGSLLKQVNDAYAYLELRNKTRAAFDGLYREDYKDYPASALRESLLNAIVHRDYAFSASTLISVYADRIEIVSIGGLVHGISLDDVMMGLSICRNQKLANIFYRLNLIEAYGTGMEKIQSAYRNKARQPEIQVTGNAFKITLPNLGISGKDVVSKPTTDYAATVENMAKESRFITRKMVEEALQVSTATATRLLKRMVESGTLVTISQGRSTRYMLTHKATR